MATFSFQLTEQTLREILTAMDDCQKESDEEMRLQVSVDIVPNGIGFAAYNQKAQIVFVQNTTPVAIPTAFLAAFESEEKL